MIPQSFPSLRRRALRIGVVVASVWLGGCILSSAPATRFYVLTPLAMDAPLAEAAAVDKPISVEVASLRLPQYLERPQIVTRAGANQLALAEYHQWGGNLRKDMLRVLAQNLAQLLGTSDISMGPHRPPVPADFRVDLEVMHFERVPEGQVQLSTQWRLSRGADRTPLVIEVTDLESTPLAAEADYEATVSAMSELYGELSRAIARAVLAEGRQ